MECNKLIKMRFLLLFFILFRLAYCGQMLTVAGKLECCTSDKTPCPVYDQATEIEIWEKNKVLPDKHLKSVMSDPQTGNFVLSIPNNNKIFAFTPYLKIAHKCNATPGCQRILKIEIPEVFVKRGWTFSITHLNLRKPFLGKTKEKC